MSLNSPCWKFQIWRASAIRPLQERGCLDAIFTLSKISKWGSCQFRYQLNETTDYKMSANSRRKRKPDHTFKYVQQNENADEKTKDADKKEGGSSKGAEKAVGKGKAGKGVAEEPIELDDSYEPPEKKEAGEDDKEASEVEVISPVKKDPYEFLSDADRKLMQTHILEFLKRFAPKFYVPVYKTWTIPKSAVH